MSGERREEARRLVERFTRSSGEAREVEVEVGEEKDRRSRSEVEELKEVLDVVSKFLKDLTEPIDRIMKTMLSAMDGSKLGEEVAAFYRKLKESGMPEEMASEMTREYFKARVQSFNPANLITTIFKEAGKKEEK
ncbi:MAG: hypothetical protein F7B17_08150 [Desulfurococcales archaeon]|nr:hypothetical protein [Desulfurococcales archaeon]